MRSWPTETEREEIHTDTWREGDSVKGEINMGNGDQECVRRCCEEIEGSGEYQNERRSGDVKAEGTKRCRK